MLGLLALSFNAHAANPLGLTGYTGIQVGNLDIEDVDIPYGLLRLGVIKENLAVELRLGTGFDDDHTDGFKVELDSLYGMYGLYHIRFSKASVYAIGGYTEGQTKISQGGNSVRVDKDGFSYGAGIEFYGVNLEYMQYLDKNDIDAKAVSIGYNYYFD